MDHVRLLEDRVLGATGVHAPRNLAEQNSCFWKRNTRRKMSQERRMLQEDGTPPFGHGACDMTGMWDCCVRRDGITMSVSGSTMAGSLSCMAT
jgi:hypothetical protein